MKVDSDVLALLEAGDDEAARRRVIEIRQVDPLSPTGEEVALHPS